LKARAAAERRTWKDQAALLADFFASTIEATDGAPRRLLTWSDSPFSSQASVLPRRI
jgi:hypothetical protein